MGKIGLRALIFCETSIVSHVCQRNLTQKRCGTDLEKTSSRGVHTYTFNVPPDQLQATHALLDKKGQRKVMKVSYSDEYNFIVRYMPSRAHVESAVTWNYAFLRALEQLTPASPPECTVIGATTFEFGPKKKQADSGVRTLMSDNPSIILEVGDLGSLGQLQTDAKLWLRDMPEVQLVILLIIDPPAPDSMLPRISLQLWRGISSAAAERDAQMVWDADWTNGATPLYIQLSDVFGQQVPDVYGDNDRVYLNTGVWQQQVIDSCALFLECICFVDEAIRAMHTGLEDFLPRPLVLLFLGTSSTDLYF